MACLQLQFLPLACREANMRHHRWRCLLYNLAQMKVNQINQTPHEVKIAGTSGSAEDNMPWARSVQQ